MDWRNPDARDGKEIALWFLAYSWNKRWFPSRCLVSMKLPTVYILASQRNGTLYIGVTSSLVRRVWEHRNGLIEGFTSKYRVHRLVYFEQYEDMPAAIAREKQLKGWHRAWKLALIEKMNPDWRDLWPELE
uniref:Putative endonuclease n=1 Tax=Candidatus Kentrum sp. LFY TaxID=2126342 RepID=A0A450X7Z3_9GAMM|nr:MAG: putative endonuclease [Candidatus Kentron sp. LFY]